MWAEDFSLKWIGVKDESFPFGRKAFRLYYRINLEIQNLSLNEKTERAILVFLVERAFA